MSIMTSNPQSALESKWWHRLVKVIIWTITGIVALGSVGIFLLFISEEGFQVIALLLLLSAPVAFFVLWAFYTKIFLYIAIGKRIAISNKGLKIDIRPIIGKVKANKRATLVVLLLLVVIGFFGYKTYERNKVRDLRYSLYEVNLNFANITKPSEYLEILMSDDYNLKYKSDSITHSKILRLRWNASELLDDAEEDCISIELCSRHLGPHIKEMQNAIKTVREYYENLGSGKDAEELLFIRDQAFEISRALRIKYLIEPDPNIPKFTHKQLSNLIDSQWNLYFVDWIELKNICDNATIDVYDLSMYKNNCYVDFFLRMFTFNFVEEEAEANLGLNSVCVLEKNYLNTATCEMTLAKARQASERYGNYLGTHKNPYYSVSRFSEESDQ